MVDVDLSALIPILRMSLTCITLSAKSKPWTLPEVLQVSVDVFVLKQLTADEVVPQAELWHGKHLGFVGRLRLHGRPRLVIPFLIRHPGLPVVNRTQTDSQMNIMKGLPGVAYLLYTCGCGQF